MKTNTKNKTSIIYYVILLTTIIISITMMTVEITGSLHEVFPIVKEIHNKYVIIYPTTIIENDQFIRRDYAWFIDFTGNLIQKTTTLSSQNPINVNLELNISSEHKNKIPDNVLELLPKQYFLIFDGAYVYPLTKDENGMFKHAIINMTKVSNSKIIGQGTIIYQDEGNYHYGLLTQKQIDQYFSDEEPFDEFYVRQTSEGKYSMTFQSRINQNTGEVWFDNELVHSSEKNIQRILITEFEQIYDTIQVKSEEQVINLNNENKNGLYFWLGFLITSIPFLITQKKRIIKFIHSFMSPK